MQVRGALAAGLGLPDPPIEFLAACAAYLVTSLTRLDHQDMAISDRLKERVPKAEAEVHAGLTALDERQAKARTATTAFASELADYRAGRAAPAEFVGRVRKFAELIQGMMAPRRNPYEAHTDRLFTSDDWSAIADATPSAIEEEATQYAGLKASAPKGADPYTMPAFHGARPPS